MIEALQALRGMVQMTAATERSAAKSSRWAAANCGGCRRRRPEIESSIFGDATFDDSPGLTERRIHPDSGAKRAPAPIRATGLDTLGTQVTQRARFQPGRSSLQKREAAI